MVGKRPPTKSKEITVDELLTAEDVGQLPKVPKAWAYEHTQPRCRDRRPSIKVGTYLRFHIKDLSDDLETANRTQRAQG